MLEFFSDEMHKKKKWIPVGKLVVIGICLCFSQTHKSDVLTITYYLFLQIKTIFLSIKGFPGSW